MKAVRLGDSTAVIRGVPSTKIVKTGHD